MEKNISLAKSAGFCYGVKRAVETVKKLKNENPDKNIFVLGEIIHNSQVIKELEDMGIKTLNELPEKGEGICVIRSHGASPQIFEAVEKAGFEIVDLTCPDVKKVQRKAIELVKEGYYLIIVGKAEHPEVVAIKANAEQFGSNIFVANSCEQLAEIESQLKQHKKIGVVVQTTQKISTFKSIIAYLSTIAKELHIMNTICASTAQRQNEAIELAKNNDLVIVVGSKNSANTSHLAEILSGVAPAIHIENEKELIDYQNEISTAQSIAITAGASTPENVIQNVINTIKGGK